MKLRSVIGIFIATAFFSAAVLFVCASFAPMTDGAPCGGMSGSQTMCPIAAQEYLVRASFPSSIKLILLIIGLFALVFFASLREEQMKQRENLSIRRVVPRGPTISNPVLCLISGGVIHSRVFSF